MTHYEYRHCRDVAERVPEEYRHRCKSWKGCLEVIEELSDGQSKTQTEKR